MSFLACMVYGGGLVANWPKRGWLSLLWPLVLGGALAEWANRIDAEVERREANG